MSTASISNPPKDHILLGHLSPNRYLNNFNNRDIKDIAMVADDTHSDW